MRSMTIAVALLIGLSLIALPGCQTEHHHHVEVKPEPQPQPQPIAQPEPPKKRVETIEETTTEETIEEKTIVK